MRIVLLFALRAAVSTAFAGDTALRSGPCRRVSTSPGGRAQLQKPAKVWPGRPQVKTPSSSE